MDPKTIYEDNFLIVLDKPAGWIVNESETTAGQNVIQDWIKNNIKTQISNDRTYRNGVVHRLDKETSGILLIAKTEEVFKELQTQFKKRVVKKTYLALVHGLLKPDEGVVQTTVGRLPWRRDRFGVVPGGRESETAYKVIAHYKKDNSLYSLVEFYPRTGRTHQIRIHAKYLGHPLVSDEFYAGRKTARDDRKWCPGLFLNAAKINFIHPGNSESVTFTSELPGDLKNALSLLEKIG